MENSNEHNSLNENLFKSLEHKKNGYFYKKDIIEHLWKVIISDDAVDQYEANLMRRLAGLLYIDSKIMGNIKDSLIYPLEANDKVKPTAGVAGGLCD